MAEALRPQRSVFEDLGVTLGIELHFEFTTFELIRLFEMCEAEPGGWLGICLDTFNMLPMLEDPVSGTKRILPWVVSTHVKDGALALEEEGLLTFPTGVGEGQIDFPAILGLLATSERAINLSVEDHGGSFRTPFRDEAFLARFPDVEEEELARLVSAARAGEEDGVSGNLAVTEREDWPSLCEARTQRGIENLRRLVEEMERRPGGGKQ
jgi:sugar phosphate isomerase/epimerase